MKDHNKKSNTVELRAITRAIEESESITQARESMKSDVGSLMRVEGAIQKLVRRDGQLKFIMTDHAGEKRMMIFADMKEDAERVKAGKYRKGAAVEIVGRLKSFGNFGINLDSCRIYNQSSDKVATNGAKKEERIEKIKQA